MSDGLVLNPIDASHFDRQAQRIQDQKAEFLKTENKKQADLNRHAETMQKMMDSEIKRTLREIAAAVKTSGTPTSIICPKCVSHDAGMIVQVAHEGEVRKYGLGIISYFLRKQADGTLACPHCGLTLRAF